MTHILSTITNFKLAIKFNYPDELELKMENEDPCKASFFDLLIEVHDRKFTTCCLIKEICFPFIPIACHI